MELAPPCKKCLGCQTFVDYPREGETHQEWRARHRARGVIITGLHFEWDDTRDTSYSGIDAHARCQEI
jgi:hypothetical protein